MTQMNVLECDDSCHRMRNREISHSIAKARQKGAMFTLLNQDIVIIMTNSKTQMGHLQNDPQLHLLVFRTFANG